MAGPQVPEFDLDTLTHYSLFSVVGEDPASILTSTVTFAALLFVAAFLSGIQLIGDPIECWCPAETSDAMCNYTKSICWISKNYVIDFDDPIPVDQMVKESTQKREMQFYPLVPFILLALAFFLKLPNLIWTAFQGEDGLSIPTAVKLATHAERDDEESGLEVAEEIIFHLTKRPPRRRSLFTVRLMSLLKIVTAALVFPLGGALGTYQTGLFLVSRALSVALTVAAFPGLSAALQADFTDWGWRLLHWVMLFGPEPVDHMHVFPRETLCDFKIRQMQNVQDYTVQCVLPINMWSEKVFLVLWFWLIILVLVNLYSYQYWFRKLLLPQNRRQLIAKHLSLLPKVAGKTNKIYNRDVTDFAFNFLNHDSILVLRVLEMSAGNRFAFVVVKNLWRAYWKGRNRKEELAAAAATAAAARDGEDATDDDGAIVHHLSGPD